MSPSRPLEDSLRETLLELLSVPSVTGEEGPLCDLVEGRLRRSAGPRQVIREGNSLAAGLLESDGRPSLALYGHLDTVPGEQTAPRQEGDRIVGLGASDMKSGLAVMMELWERVPADAPVRLLVVFYDREEGDYDLNGLGPLLERVPALSACDLALCLEPTGGQLQLGCVGSLHARLTLHGTAAHSARPWLGENAVYAALPLLQELAARPAKHVECGGLDFREVAAVTLAHAGGGRNVVPDRFELNLNLRFAPGRSLEEVEGELVDWVGGRAELEVIDRSPAAPVCADNPLLRHFVALSEDIRVEAKQAWTDVARLAAAGVDAANYGPGLQAQAHRVGEFCEFPLVFESYLRLERLLVSGR